MIDPWQLLREARFVIDTLDDGPTATETVSRIDAALAEHEAATKAEPVAWLHEEDGRVDVIHARVNDLWWRVRPKQVEHYTIPLYIAPPSALPPGHWAAPDEPTHVMINAGIEQRENGGFSTSMRDVYIAMRDAATGNK